MKTKSQPSALRIQFSAFRSQVSGFRFPVFRLSPLRIPHSAFRISSRSLFGNPLAVRRGIGWAGRAVALALVFSMSLGGNAWAAPINWNSATTISGDTNVLNAGALNYAYTFSSIATAPTVNSVLFTKTNSTTTIGTNVTLSGFTNNNGTIYQSSPSAGTWAGLTTAYKGMLQGGDYGGTGAATVTLQSLTSGHVYATQIWVDDSRATGASRTETVTSTGGNTVTLDYNSTDANGGVGQYTTGRFVADAATQVFTLQGNISTQLNAFQVRDVTNIGNWVGTGGATWDAATTNNFASNLFSAALTTTTFATAKAPLSAVTFADTYWSSSVQTAVTQTNVTVDAAGVSTGTVYFDNSSVNYTIGNASGAIGITGATAIVKNGSGTVTLNGVNTHTGGTTITAGTLKTGVNGALGNGNYALTITGGTFDLNGVASQQVSAFNGSGGTVLNSVNGGTAILVVGGDHLGGTYSGTIADNAGGGATGKVALSKVGNGTQILSGPNTYTGNTTLSSGTIQIGIASVGSVGSITSSAIGKGTLTFNGGTLSSDSTTDRIILNAVTFTGNAVLGDATKTGKLTFAAGLDLGAATRTMTLNSDVQLDGAFSNPGANSAVVKDGSGTLTINVSNAGVDFGAGNPSGFQIKAGKVLATNTAAFGSAGQIVTLNGGTGTSAGSTVEFATDSSPNAYVLNQNSGNNGTVILNRATSGTAITYSMGTAALGSGNIFNVQKGGNVTDTPTLALTGLTLSAGSAGTTTLSPTTANISITGAVTASGAANLKTLQLDGTSTDNLISGNISDGTATPLSLTKANTGTWTLSGNNGYTGATTINAGTLAAGSSTAFNNTSALSMAGSGTLNLGGFDASFTSINAGVSTNTITTSGLGTATDTLTISNMTPTNTNFAGLISDGATRKVAVAISSNGLNTGLSNVNNTFSGGFTLLGQTGANTYGVKLVPVTGATVSGGVVTKGPYGTGSIYIGQAATDKAQFYFTADSVTLANNIVVNTSAGTDAGGTFRVESKNNTISGAIQANQASVMLYHNGQYSGGTGGASSITLTGPISTGALATAGLTVQESNYTSANGRTLTVILNNSNVVPSSYTGATTVTGQGATLQIGASDQIPNGSGKGIVAVNTSAILDLNGYSETINGLTGAGTIDNVAATGGLTNTLTLGDGDATGNSFTGVIKNTAGTLSVAKIGTGTQTFGGANTFTGGLFIKNGTVTASTVNTALGGATGTGTVTLGDTTGSNPATLLVGTTGLNYANPIVLATNPSVGTLTLGNAGTAISTTFSGGVTGNNSFTINENATTGTISFATGDINNAGAITNIGAGTGSTSISANIGSNVTDVTQNSSTAGLDSLGQQQLHRQHGGFLGNTDRDEGGGALRLQQFQQNLGRQSCHAEAQLRWGQRLGQRRVGQPADQ